VLLLSLLSPTAGAGTATAVLVASFIGVPVSTTQCAIGSVVFVGVLNPQGWRAVRWSLFGKVALSWALTLPLAGGISAALFAAFRPVVAGVDVSSLARLVVCTGTCAVA